LVREFRYRAPRKYTSKNDGCGRNGTHLHEPTSA
jgi:hypothetical protein